MVINDTKTERIKNSILNTLDKLKYVHRRDSYSKRIEYFIRYCFENKKQFEKWLEEEIKNEERK